MQMSNIIWNAPPQSDISFNFYLCNNIFACILITSKSLLKFDLKKKQSWHRCLIRKNVVNFILNHFFVHDLRFCVSFPLALWALCIVAVFSSFKWKIIFLFKLILVVTLNEFYEKKNESYFHTFSLPMANRLKNILIDTTSSVFRYFVPFFDFKCREKKHAIEWEMEGMDRQKICSLINSC